MSMQFVALSFLLCLILFACFNPRPVRRRRNLPPGPPPLPLIGNIHQLGRKPHQSLTKLSKTHGPIMHLKLGTVDAIVVSSPNLAKQVLQKHDHLLSGRFQHAVTDIDSHNTMSVVWLPPGPHWRDLRRLVKDQMSVQRLDATEAIRREKVKSLREYVQECCDGARVVDIANAAFVTSMNLTTATMFSMDFGHFDSDTSREFKEIVQGFMRVLGTPNLADFFPVLKAVDPQGLKRQAKLYSTKVRRIFIDIMDQRLMGISEPKNDFLEILLDMNRKNEFNREEMIHLLLDLFVAGMDTTATTEEWAMAELIRNPKEMAKVRKEVQRVVGEKGEPVKESDISKLPYLQAVLKETLRLHPAGPLLIPHKAEADTEIDGYVIPKNAQVLVNIWAIGRDSSIWSNPDSFEPQRFLESKVDVKGQDFELIPFGSGRRICPGMPLAHRMVHLVVATLVQNFEWKLEGGVKPQELDMNEKFEFSMKKAVPLKAVPIKL